MRQQRLNANLIKSGLSGYQKNQVSIAAKCIVLLVDHLDILHPAHLDKI